MYITPTPLQSINNKPQKMINDTSNNDLLQHVWCNREVPIKYAHQSIAPIDLNK